MKVCRTCKAEKPLRAFYRTRRWRENECKECKRTYARERHWGPKRDVILAQKRDYYSRTRPQRRAAQRAYYQTPRGRSVHRESQRFYHAIRRMEARA